MESIPIKSLLEIVRVLTKQEEQIKKEKQRRGEYFNVFDVLGLSSNEVRLHSALLANLLNPNANHGLKGAFLDAFQQMMHDRFKNLVYLDVENTKVETEKFIGRTTKTTGGRIDIFISDGKSSLIIENKIYAGDQPNQMLRYGNYGKSLNNQFNLIYLSLFPLYDDETPKAEGFDVSYITYRDDIIPWLKRCCEIATSNPAVRETIQQYISLLKNLTNTDMENSNELYKLLSNEQNIDSAFAIANNFPGTLNYIVNKIFIPQLTEKAKEIGIESKLEERNWMSEPYAGFHFNIPKMNNFVLKFEFEHRGMRDQIVGFVKKGRLERKDIENWTDIQEALQSRDRRNPSWVYYINFEECRTLYTPMAVKQMLSGEMAKIYISKIKALMEMVKDLKM